MSVFCNRLTVFALLGGLVLLFPADGLRALGLGEARVDSYLGQPLDVTIRLLDAESEAVEAMTVAPASPADHDRLGLPSESLGLGLDVSIDRASEPPTIRLRSERPVNDPIVQVLLDARFASGRVLREYTLFLDPPTVESPPPDRRAPEAATEPEVDATPVDPAAREERPAPRQPAPADPDPAAERPQITDDSVTVARGDTLWSIGYNWRPDSGMSMDQVMLAIFERNRHAFMDENINRLRSGAELDMPSTDEVRGVGRAEAEQRIREHMQAWQQADPTRDVPVVADAGVPEADTVEPSPATTEEPEDVVHRLDVVPPEDEEFADGPAVSDGDIRRVRGALTEIEEEIAAERLESEAFDEHVAEIREALDSRDVAGLAFAEESLAELEARLREARREREEAERLAAVEEDDVDTYFSELERELVGDPAEETPVPDDEPAVAAIDEAPDPDDELAPGDPVTDPAEEAAPAEADEPVAAAPEPEAQTGLALWQWLALAVAIIILLLVAVGAFVYIRQRRSATGDISDRVASTDGEADARKAVARDPSDLAAHLALLKVLADGDENERFADALDQMYQHVDDEEDVHWQEALGLAVVHAPDHPMLTPPETAPGDLGDDDLGRRTDEMLSMFDVDDDDDEGAAHRADSDAEEESLEPDEEHAEADTATEDALSDADEEFGEDLDLGELSNRLDEPDSEPGSDNVFAADDDDFEIGGYAEEEAEPGDQAEAVEPGRAEDDDLDLDLDFESGADVGEPRESVDEPSETDDEAPGAGFDLELDEGFDQELKSEPESAAPAEQDSPGDMGEQAPDSEPLSLDFGSEEVSDDLADDLAVDEPDASDSEQPQFGDDVDEDDALTLDFEDDSDTDIDSPAEVSAGDEPDLGKTDDSEELEESAIFDLDEDSGSNEAPDAETDERAPDSEAGSRGDADLSDEDAEVKLDLARAYMSVDLADSARTILDEVVAGGSPEKQDEARKLLDEL